MSDTKFTQGEWIIVEGDSFSKEVCITTDKREGSLTVPICEMDIRFHGDIGLEQSANMHLISAAPDLYAALDAMIDLHISDFGATGIVLDDSIIDRACAALAKARGEK